MVVALAYNPEGQSITINPTDDTVCPFCLCHSSTFTAFTPISFSYIHCHFKTPNTQMDNSFAIHPNSVSLRPHTIILKSHRSILKIEIIQQVNDDSHIIKGIVPITDNKYVLAAWHGCKEQVCFVNHTLIIVD